MASTKAVTPPEDLELGLRALALAGNNSGKAADNLQAAGHTVTQGQLRAWRTSHADRYHAIRQHVQNDVAERMAIRAEDISIQAMRVQRLAIDEAEKQLKAGKARDPSASAKNLAQTAHLNGQQAALLRGNPTQIIEQRSAEEILKSLAGKLPPNTFIESTAEEITA